MIFVRRPEVRAHLRLAKTFQSDTRVLSINCSVCDKNFNTFLFDNMLFVFCTLVRVISIPCIVSIYIPYIVSSFALLELIMFLILSTFPSDSSSMIPWSFYSLSMLLRAEAPQAPPRSGASSFLCNGL